ncbi:MAG: bifunctional riboflavin kinase/FAD synthetase [Akkermansiaceae bacterium]|nr:bifunctional riboflavin kinase/FAD synthetase [Akkermansiaceae bacterium]
MLIRKKLEDLQALGVPLHLALGVFDGVHLGHQAVIARAVDAASRDGGLAGVLTFDPHPIRVIAPAKAPSALLETLEHKAQVMNHLGVQLLIPLHFDQELAAMEAAEFIAKLLTANVRTIAVGEDWRFGHHRSGDVTMLQNESAIHGFRLEAVPPVMHEGERISSTRIRQAIRDGNLVSAEQMLGRPFTVTGNVVEGKKLGRTIGFPTANLRTVDAQLPPSGVWVVRARLPDGSHVGGVANIGVCPTVGGTTRSLEVHLLDFQGDLYGKNLEIQFLNYLRPEAKFPSIEALRVQIQLDTNTAREILKGK